MNDAKPILGEDTIFGRLYYQDADYDALRAELAELLDRLDVMTQCADNYSRMFEESSEQRDTAIAQLAAIQGGMGEVVGFDRNAAYAACPESGCDWGSFYVGWKAAAAQHQRIVAALSAQQSAPERVSVPRDLLADLISSDHDTKIQAERALYALLASHAEGGKV